jgi:hypothetical protein
MVVLEQAAAELVLQLQTLSEDSVAPVPFIYITNLMFKNLFLGSSPVASLG